MVLSTEVSTGCLSSKPCTEDHASEVHPADREEVVSLVLATLTTALSASALKQSGGSQKGNS